MMSETIAEGHGGMNILNVRIKERVPGIYLTACTAVKNLKPMVIRIENTVAEDAALNVNMVVPLKKSRCFFIVKKLEVLRWKGQKN